MSLGNFGHSIPRVRLQPTHGWRPDRHAALDPLSPDVFYRETPGLPADTSWIDVPSPYAAEQLTAHVARYILTQFFHRRASAAPIGQLLAEQFNPAPGNYLAFFSSYEDLELVASD